MRGRFSKNLGLVSHPPAVRFNGRGRAARDAMGAGNESVQSCGMMQAKDLALCGACALVMPIGQIMFKMAANRHNGLSGSIVGKLLHNPMLFGAFAIYGASSLLWFFILTRLPLSQAYPIVIVGAGLVPILSWMVFREPLSPGLFAGYVLILSGLALIQRAVG